MSVTTRAALRDAIHRSLLTDLKAFASHLCLYVRGNKHRYVESLQSYFDDVAHDPQQLRTRLVQFNVAPKSYGSRFASLHIEALVADYAVWYAQKTRAAHPQAALRPPPQLPPPPPVGASTADLARLEQLRARTAAAERAALAAAAQPQRGASMIDTPWGRVHMAEAKYRIDPYFQLLTPLAMRKLSAGSMADCIDFKLGQQDLKLLIDEPQAVHVALLVTYQDALYLSAKHTVREPHGAACHALLESRLMSTVAVNSVQIKFHKNPSYLIDKGKADKVHPILLSGSVRKDSSVQTVAVTSQVSPSTGLVGLVAVVRQFTPEQVLAKVARASVAQRISEIQAANGDDDDDDDFDLNLKVSLMDPVLMTRIATPLRTTSCKHADCCDALTFLRQNAQTPTYTCPHCNYEVGSLPSHTDFARIFAEPLGDKLRDRLVAERRKASVLVALPVLERLRVDEHFAGMLRQVGQDLEQVALDHVSGRWVIPGSTAACDKAKETSVLSRSSSSQPAPMSSCESKPILMAPVRSLSPMSVPRSSRAPSASAADKVVVDLMDSDDDDTAVVRRRSHAPSPRAAPVQRSRPPVSHGMTPSGAGLSEVVDLTFESDDDDRPVARAPAVPSPTPPAGAPAPAPAPTPALPTPAASGSIASTNANGNGNGNGAESCAPSSPLRLSSPLRRPRSAISDDDENDDLVRMSPSKRRRKNVIGDDGDLDRAPTSLSLGSGVAGVSGGASASAAAEKEQPSQPERESLQVQS